MEYLKIGPTIASMARPTWLGNPWTSKGSVKGSLEVGEWAKSLWDTLIFFVHPLHLGNISDIFLFSMWHAQDLGRCHCYITTEYLHFNREIVHNWAIFHSYVSILQGKRQTWGLYTKNFGERWDLFWEFFFPTGSSRSVWRVKPLIWGKVGPLNSIDFLVGHCYSFSQREELKL